jgi:hypothetical protein
MSEKVLSNYLTMAATFSQIPEIKRGKSLPQNLVFYSYSVDSMKTILCIKDKLYNGHCECG